MPIFETPYGTVDAPHLEAAQKWIARQKGGGGVTEPPDRIAEQRPEQPSWLQSLIAGGAHGLGNIVHAGAQIGARMGQAPEIGQTEPSFTPEKVQQVDSAARQREQAFQASPERRAHPIASGIGEVGGEAAGTTAEMGPLMAAGAPGWLGKLLTGAASGAIGGVTGSPVTAEPKPATATEPAKLDFWDEKAKQAGIGAAAGGAVTAAGGAAGRAIAPRLGPDQAALAAKGVQMTPGRMIGGMAIGGEDVAKSFPILGHFIQGGQKRTLQSFNAATINQALEPIGASLPKNAQAGNEAVKVAGNALSKAYDDALGRVPSVMADHELTAALKAIETQARRNPDVWRKLEPAIKHDIYDEFANAGWLEGRDVKTMISEQAKYARRYNKSIWPDDQELGKHYEAIRDALKDAVKRQYPAEAPNIQAADNGWAMLTRIEQAAGRRKGGDGIFTPLDLLSASAAQAGGVSRGGVRREFARGDALFQEWGKIAQRVLPSTVPDSGTAGRLLAADIAGGVTGVGAAMVNPLATLGTVGGLTAAGLPYTGPASRAMQRFMQPGAARSGARTAAGAIGRGAAPGAGAAANRPREKKRELRPSPVGG